MLCQDGTYQFFAETVGLTAVASEHVSGGPEEHGGGYPFDTVAAKGQHPVR